MASQRKLILDGLALISGAILPLSLAPFDWWILAIIAPGALYYILQTDGVGRSVRRIYLFNVGMFAVGASWIYVSIHQYGGASVPLAAFLVVVFVLAYSLVSIPLGYLYVRYLRHGDDIGMAFAAIWVLQECFRSWFLTGFPWLFVGYAFLDTPLQAFATIGGVFAVSLVALFIAVWISRVLVDRKWVLLLPIVAMLSGSYFLQKQIPTEPSRTISVSLVQGNIDQHVKWHPRMREVIINKYLEATEPELGRDLIIWPEAAITVFRQSAGPLIAALNERLGFEGSALLLGIPDRNSGGGFQNTVMGVGLAEGQYIKRRLVPFGEYVPLEGLLRGLIEFFDLPMSRNESGPAEQSPIIAGDLVISTSICYEVVYPDLVRQTVSDPDLLVTVSNDTWFGESIGPFQHMQMARMRALENGKPMLRATNNGITAVINRHGKVVSRLPQFQQGVLRSDLQLFHGSTLFHQIGSLPTLLLALLLLVAVFTRGILRPE